MKIITAFVEALLVCILFALFAVPFFVINQLSATQSTTQTIAQNK